MTFERGSLIMVDYTARLKDADTVIETTRAADSPKLEDPKPGAVYRPKLVSIGDPSYPVPKGFDAALAEAEIAVPQTVEVPPDGAFGERSRSKVKMVTLRKLGEDADRASVGDVVTVDKRVGTVRFIGSGRVQIDFNLRYAGRSILYDFNVVKSLDSAADRIEAILGNVGMLPDPAGYTLEGDKLEVRVPEGMLRNDKLQNTKYLLQMGLFQFVPDLSEVRFVETYNNAAKTSPPEPAEDEPEADG